jgi:hypothetical protein
MDLETRGALSLIRLARIPLTPAEATLGDRDAVTPGVRVSG